VVNVKQSLRPLAALFVVALGLVGLPSPVAAHLGSTDTNVVVAGLLEVRFHPGICAPGAASLRCEATNEIVPFEARTLSCTANGTFEGRTLPPDAPCQDRFEGALVGNPPGSTPNCVAGARFESTGTFRIAGLERSTSNRSLVRVDGSIGYQAWIQGDHVAFATLRAEQADPPPSPNALFCVTRPLRGFVARQLETIQ
jgi:hypothetical protein